MDRDELRRRIAMHLKRDFPEVPNPDDDASGSAVALWPNFERARSAQEELRELRAALAEQYPDAAAGVRLGTARHENDVP